jgi:hypothetical protein
MDLIATARAVHERLTSEPRGTLILVERDGRVRTEILHGADSGPWPRERPVATFVSTAPPASEKEIRLRLLRGLYKLASSR